MPIPTYDQLLRPVLELSLQENITIRSATAKMVECFSLSEDEKQAQIRSGQTYIQNRTGWAMSHLKKAGFLEKVPDLKHTYRGNQKGKEYLDTHQGPITPKKLRGVEGFVEAWEKASQKNKKKRQTKTSSNENGNNASNATPEELIDEAVTVLDDSLRSELLEQLAGTDPYFFEQVVIDLLFAMGYGGSREEAAQVTRKSNDEGIDGIINEDRLGLDVIYVQAKRWQGSVGRKEVQSFVGALAGKQANKGIFITTSQYAQNAIDYAKTVSQKVILIDGLRLADLMIEYDIGVTTQRTIALKRIDSDYFEN